MREILFRGFSENLKHNEWVYGDLVKYDDATYYILPQDFKCWDILHDGTLIDKSTVGQFTGLTDKHDTNVFDGDKFNVKGKEMFAMYIEDRCRYILTTGNGFDSKNAIDLDCDVICNLEVIGNIHTV